MAKSEKMSSVSASRLKYAREYYGLSTADVVRQIKSIKSEDLERYEQGLDFPTYTKLESLANLYNRPLLYFFFQSDPPQEKLAVAFRSIEQQNGCLLDMQVRTMMEKADWYRMNLLELFGPTPPIRFIDLLNRNQINSSAKLSVWLRQEIDLPLKKQKADFTRADELLEYLREKLYQIGIYIFKDSFRADNVSGLCLYDENYPVILLNNKTSFTRQVFTVFHEIYHLFSKETDVYYPQNNEEKACDKFSSEFLIPSADFQNRIAREDDFEDVILIQDLAKEYTVSPSAIAYRLLVLGKISSKFYQSIQHDGIRKMNSATSGGNYYYTKISYLGKPYLNQVFANYYAGKISISTVGKYTGLKTSHISKLSSNMFGGAL